MTAGQILKENQQKYEPEGTVTSAATSTAIEVDFADYPDMKTQIETEAKKEMRPVAMQILYYLSKRDRSERPAAAAVPVPMQKCAECTMEFPITRKGRKYCSTECKTEANRRINANRISGEGENGGN